VMPQMRQLSDGFRKLHGYAPRATSFEQRGFGSLEARGPELAA
jgi:hypothetical protein